MRKKLRLDPQATRHVGDARCRNNGSWFYEDKRGLWCVVEYDCSGYKGVKSFLIPRMAVLEYARIAKS